MANQVGYIARLRAERWIEPVVLSVADITALSRDMAYVRDAIKSLSERNLSLVRKVQALRDGRVPPPRAAFCRAPKEAMTLSEVAVQIAESAAELPVVAYRKAGRVKWQPAERALPKDAEFIGTYDEGADWRCIEQDLAA